MFHIGKSGSPTRCRAIVRPCPLGGEARLFAELGIEGPARPSPVEAREHGMYDTIYGAQLKKRAEAEARREARAAQAGAVNPRHSPEYAAQVESVRTQLTEFKDKHADTLKNSTGKYFMARQKLTAAEQEYLDDLDAVGNSLNELAAAGVYRQAMSDYDEAHTRSEALREQRFALDNKCRDEMTKEYYDENGNLRGEDYSVLVANAEVVRQKYLPEIERLKQEEKEQELIVEQQYETTYGAAFKTALEDVGVKFADGEYNYNLLVGNADSVSPDLAQETKTAISYYPADWMDNVEDKVTVARHRKKGSGFVRYRRNSYGFELQTGGYEASIHEWGHVAEISNREIGRAERLFLIQEKKHSSHSKVINMDSKKNIATDSMIDLYSGVYYKGKSAYVDAEKRGNTYEVLTTGAEALFAGARGGFRTNDSTNAPRHRNFMLGIFATQATTTPPADNVDNSKQVG